MRIHRLAGFMASTMIALLALPHAAQAQAAAPAPPDGERLGQLVYRTPAGWQKQEVDGRVVLTPPGVASADECAIELWHGGPPVKTFAEDVAARIVDVAKGRKVVGPGKIERMRGAGAEIIYRPMVVQAPDGKRQWLFVWAAEANGYIQHALYSGSSDEIFKKHWKEANAFMGALRFHVRQVAEGAGATTRPGATSRPAAVPLATDNRPLALYVGNIAVAPAPNATGAAAKPKPRAQHIALFAGGMAIHSASLPPNGLASGDLEAFRRTYPDDVGSFTLDKAALTIKLPRSTLALTVRQDRIVRNDPPNTEYLTMPRTVGVAIQGTYRIEGADPKGPFISFDPEGRFREQGRLRIRPITRRPDGRTEDPNDQPGGVGTYAVHDYEIELRFDDGRVERMSFYLPPHAAQNRGVMVVNGWRLMLQG